MQSAFRFRPPGWWWFQDEIVDLRTFRQKRSFCILQNALRNHLLTGSSRSRRSSLPQNHGLLDIWILRALEGEIPAFQRSTFVNACVLNSRPTQTDTCAHRCVDVFVCVAKQFRGCNAGVGVDLVVIPWGASLGTCKGVEPSDGIVDFSYSFLFSTGLVTVPRKENTHQKTTVSLSGPIVCNTVDSSHIVGGYSQS